MAATSACMTRCCPSLQCDAAAGSSEAATPNSPRPAVRVRLRRPRSAATIIKDASGSYDRVNQAEKITALVPVKIGYYEWWKSLSSGTVGAAPV